MVALLFAALLALTPTRFAAAQEPTTSGPPSAAPSMEVADLPPELAPWVPWVLADHPDLACPLAGVDRACVWPGLLSVDARSDGAALRLAVTVDREADVALPGGAGAWPLDVRDGGRPLPVRDVAGVPTVTLAAGRHELTGRIAWATMPRSVPIPGRVAQVELSVGGARTPWPRIDEDGLRLGAGDARAPEENRTDLTVMRLVQDGLPVVVQTVVELRAAGAGREVVLGDVLVPGTEPVSLQANLPARFDADGGLVVQIRPGTWTVTFDAVHVGPAASLSAPQAAAPWPDREYWSVKTDERVRAVNLAGPDGIDPARTPVPEAWRLHPTFLVTADTPLTLEELRRGEPTPLPNRLDVHRELWLDADGGGLTVRDHIDGAMNQRWRLDVAAPADLGHVSDRDVDQVITRTADGAVGVELRAAEVRVVAESRIEARPSVLPAVGWQVDANRLDATLNLPPGWTLLTGTGVDSLDGSVLDQWTLFDLFFVLVLAMAVGRLVGLRWGLVALAGLVLGRHSAGAPQWSWAAVVVLAALVRVLPDGWWRQGARALRVVAVVALAGILVPFAVDQVQTGLFPALEMRWVGGGVGGPGGLEEIPDRFVELQLEQKTDSIDRKMGARSSSSSSSMDRYLSVQIDPTAVVQTGPGVPDWTWRPQLLRWTGPVGRDHTMRLVLLGPRWNMALAFLRVLLLGALGVRLAELGVRRWKRAAPVVAALLLAPLAHAQTPSDALLTELEARLTAPPACSPSCVDVPSLAVAIRGGRLVVEAKVHATVDGAWPIPGPATAWVPERVTLDGAPSTALRRQADGFLYARVPAGVHTVRAEGPLPPVDALALQLGLRPHRVSWTGDGWAVDGVKADGTVEGSLQLARVLGGATTDAQSSENLAPWLEVHRHLDLGIPWRVRTTVVRIGPKDHPVSLRVPLLPGEAVTDTTFEVHDGLVAATLDRDVAEVSWLSTLEETGAVQLDAPTGAPWTERWTLTCSPIFACSAEGPAPLAHVRDGEWSPEWRVWPGESVTLSIGRPEGVAGQTVTIDDAMLTVRPGRRQLVSELTMTVRSSQGGRQVVTLPLEAELQQVLIDGAARPIQARAGNEVPLPLQPGTQELTLRWQQPHPPSVIDTVPAVDLGGPAVNTRVVVEPMRERWLVALSGPRWGPTPLFWTYVVIVLLVAPLLARLPYAPLKLWQWALLGLGMTQVPVFAPIVVAAWFVALGWKAQREPTSWWAHDLAQLGLVVWTLAALGMLYASIHAGLLVQPDMQVAGGGSHDAQLVWFVDRIDGAMPRPTVVSFPMWVWRVLMLLWSLWLAASLVRWLPWAWRAFAHGGLLRRPDKRSAPNAAAD